jgi:hypothetical protein
VGPVRSGRFFDENIARMYQSFLVFKFADKRVLGYLRTTDIAEFLVVPGFGNCPPFKNMAARKLEVYNNNYFNTILWEDCVAKHNLSNEKPFFHIPFSNDAPTAAGVDGTDIYTYYSQYSYNHWAYDSGTSQYLRFQETDDLGKNGEEKYAPLMDNVTGLQVHASNVVVLFAYHTFANPFDQEDEVYHIDLEGNGQAYVFRDGKGIPAKWNRTAKNHPLTLTTTSGDLIPLKPGITYYEVIGTNSYASQGDGQWFFHHQTP